MPEKLKANPFKTIQEQSKAKPGEEGALGPIDNYNRLSYKISKPAAIGTGLLTAAGLPLMVPFVLTTVWAGSDKFQIEGSKWLRRRMKKESRSSLKQTKMEPGKWHKLPKAA